MGSDFGCCDGGGLCLFKIEPFLFLALALDSVSLAFFLGRRSCNALFLPCNARGLRSFDSCAVSVQQGCL
ncbi:hypothetical protein LX76_04008 [Cereibacter changlensis]|uniref:Uncharacterized protein n=1 Tax=Cereibacter changlensis TaxID=402884 RepID=A0A2W7QZ59_9RHOB|nr:hypothetical protein LX76_04008 [Cereibacter changlensis]